MSTGCMGASRTMRLVNRLRNTNIEKFHTMVKMHLSFLLDLPGTGLEQLLGETTVSPTIVAAPLPEKSKLHFPHFGKKKSIKENKNACSGIFGVPLSVDVLHQIYPLIQWLGKTENVQQEGLFRKSGQIARQRILRERLCQHKDPELDLGLYTAHDVASVLKTFLGELPEPLLSEKHYVAHCQVPEMASESKQLQTVQLLIQLLHRENQELLESLLQLLHKVALQDSNKMTAETLGTLFAPHLLAPRKMTAAELQSVAPNLTKTVSFMIDKANEVIEIPEALVRDIANYWDEMEEMSDKRSSSGHTEDELDSCRIRYRRRVDHSDVAMNTTTLSFADRQASHEAATKTDTQVALAQLYAHVSSMPESAKKRKLLKQFNKANGNGSPVNTSIRDKHKRSKSLSDSLKKMVGRNHKRRGSGNGMQVHTVLSENQAPVHQCMPYSTQHTPIIKQRPLSTTSPLVATPVMQLFRSHLQKPVLPSSPHVHIVDLKQNMKPTCGKRKEPGTDLPVHPVHLRVNNLVRFSRVSSQHDCHMEDRENRPVLFPAAQPFKKSTLSPVVITPERQFDKPTAFISPITRSVSKAPKLIQDSVMVPGSRLPMAMIQTP